jgi:hypothetical protein
MNLDKFPEMKPESKQMLRDLKQAYDECVSAQIATYEVARKHAPLCIKILKDFLGDVPKLINNQIEARKKSSKGRGVLEFDFWADDKMIVALWEHLEMKLDLHEVENGSSSRT